MRSVKIFVSSMLLTVFSFYATAEVYTHHDIEAEIFPDKNAIKVKDRITFPENPGEKIQFLLHGGLAIETFSQNINIIEIKGEINTSFFGINTSEFKINEKIPVKRYEVTFLNKNTEHFSFEIVYSGRIYHEIEQVGSEYARGFSETPGIISTEGVYLSGSSFWLPRFNDNLVTFEIKVSSPEKWASLSQGKRVGDSIINNKNLSHWISPEPMDEVYLISAEFFKYHIKSGNTDLYAYLRTDDKSLAMKYLNTTGQYLEMYNNLIGPYPYSKFALVENFWETGYGMPSFTLLGSRIIRFPFILHSSYPHELLHNWWGNSVFVDYKKGNWCEGLTVFLADHLIKEQVNQGLEYRRTTLQGYTDYVNDSNDFPVSDFRARYDSASSAIGYGKVMMIFNMLRYKLGDEIFIRAVRDFYENNKYRKADFGSIRNSSEKISGKDLDIFFDQWVNEKGAPVLKINNSTLKESNSGFELTFQLEQEQKRIYELTIPVAVYLEDEKEVRIIDLEMKNKYQKYDLSFKNRPLRIDIDPFFDVFRRLSDEEIPASLSKIFGSKNVLIILPEKDDSLSGEKYEDLALNWAGDKGKTITVVSDNELTELPSDRDIWIFGWENKFRPIIDNELTSFNSRIESDNLHIRNEHLDRRKNSIVLAVKNPADRSKVMVLVSADIPEAVEGLGRKLPHYGKYSYLAFSGPEPSIGLKGQWESKRSPMIRIFDEKKQTDHKFPERKALGYLAPVFSKEDMKDTVEYLSDPRLEGRGIGTGGLDSAAEFISRKFAEYGLQPGSEENTFIQEWKAITGPDDQLTKLKNIIAFIPGSKNEFAGQSVLLTAHYDHLGLGWPDVREGNKGKVHPGADDNASGVSVLLEIAKNLGKDFLPERNIVFAAFTGEENNLSGSEYFVKNYKKFPVKEIIGVINLDTVGRLNGKKPMIIGSDSAREWKFMFMGIGYTTGIESEMILQELDASDQISFIRKGIPAVQIFSGPHLDYHTPGDTPEKIDYDGLISIAGITREGIVYLSERDGPMTFTGRAGEVVSVNKGDKRSGRASIGIMPDFSYSSEGVRVGLPIKSAEGDEHVLKEGDIIMSIGEYKIKNLKEYSAALKNFSPGDEVEIVYIRDNKEFRMRIFMRSR